jgi:fumarate hydratase subunit alpha
MREINASEITRVVEELVIKANKILPDDLVDCIGCSKANETKDIAKSILSDLEANIDAAKELDIPVCQDTGMAVIFAEIGQDVHIVGGSFEKAVNDGVSQGYINGLLRKSVVADPFKNRVNTNDNTPAIIHTSIVDGDKIKITAAPKGFGSENMSKIKMFTPSAKRENIVDFIVDCVKTAGSNPCPPVVIGVGIGGDFEYSAILAKKLFAGAFQLEIVMIFTQIWKRSFWTKLMLLISAHRDLVAIQLHFALISKLTQLTLQDCQ